MASMHGGEGTAMTPALSKFTSRHRRAPAASGQLSAANWSVGHSGYVERSPAAPVSKEKC